MPASAAVQMGSAIFRAIGSAGSASPPREATGRSKQTGIVPPPSGAGSRCRRRPSTDAAGVLRDQNSVISNQNLPPPRARGFLIPDDWHAGVLNRREFL